MIKRAIPGTFMNSAVAGAPVEVDFVYLGEADPLVIHLTFKGPQNDSSWQVSRDLLADGMVKTKWAGEGDIRVKSMNNYYFIQLRPPGSGQGVGFSFPKDEVKRFIIQTFASIPRQAEQSFFDEQDIDAEFALLLNNDD